MIEYECTVVGVLLELPEQDAFGGAADGVGGGEVVPVAGDGYFFAAIGQEDDVVVCGGVEVVEGAIG